MLLLVLFAWTSTLSAQSAQERQAAAEAFDRGTTSYLAEDFATAARWFEMANNLAPAAPALLQAIRAHQRAGNELRAGTLALRLVERFPDAGPAVEECQRIVDGVRQRFFFVEVVCDSECAVELDGTLQAHPAFFLEPARTYRVGASFASGNVAEEITGAAGEQRTVRLNAPEGGPIQGPDGAEGSTRMTGDSAWTRRDDTRAGGSDDEESGGGVHPAGFLTTLALTLGAGGVLVWSGMDTLSARDEYEEVAARERSAGETTFPEATQLLADGRDKERRTNILIGATAGLAVVTVVMAIVTDWGGSDDDERATTTIRPSLAFDRDGAQLGLGGSF